MLHAASMSEDAHELKGGLMSEGIPMPVPEHLKVHPTHVAGSGRYCYVCDLSWDNPKIYEPCTKAGHEFRRELAGVINRFSMENGSNTPDFILAEFLYGCLQVFNRASNAREQWYGSHGDRAGFAYEAYCETVGWKSVNGEPLPRWAELVADPAKQKVVDGWRAVAAAI